MTAIKPEGWDRKGCEAFKYFLYNPETGEYLSRTPLSWLKITVFYCIYYSLLAAFWIACLHIFFLTIPEDHPRWLNDASIIGSNPGLGIRPSSTDERIDSSIFSLEIGDRNTTETNEDGEGDKNIDYAVRLRKYMKMYNDTTDLQDCTLSNSTDGRCIFDTSVLQECATYPYGYVVETESLAPNEGFNPGGGQLFAEPCIFLKLNKIFGWTPKPIQCGDNECSVLKDKKYDKMTKDLKDKIAAHSRVNDSNYVWIDCFGRYAADKEALDLQYFPSTRGMPLKYFPYGGGNYHTPLVAIKVLHKKAAICSGNNLAPYMASNCGQLVQVECRAWFDGVIHDTKDKAGLVQFEIQMIPAGTNHKDNIDTLGQHMKNSEEEEHDHSDGHDHS